VFGEQGEKTEAQ